MTLCPAKLTPVLDTGAPLQIGRESPPPDEAIQLAMIETVSRASMRLKGDRPPPIRLAQHPKSHGYLQGEFTIQADLPGPLAQGLFARPATYACWVRFSNGSAQPDGQLASDWNPQLQKPQPDLRAVAIKLLAVPGEFLPEAAERSGEQDFLLINSKVFMVRNVAEYLPFLSVVKLLSRLERDPELPPPIDFEAQKDRVRASLEVARRCQEQPIASPLELSYWSATPYRLGEAAMKFKLEPVAVGRAPDPSSLAADRSHFLRDAIKAQLAQGDALFDFKIQIQTDPQAMPIEDAMTEWPEDVSPYRTVARLRLPSQEFDTPERRAADEQQSFSPWQALAAHRPLGGVNRARRLYGDLARQRNALNSGPWPQP